MPKKSMTILDVKAWITETKSILGNARIVNIYGEENIYLVKLWAKTSNVKPILLIEPGRRIHLTEYEHKVHEAKTPPPLIQGLRKYLRGGVIEDIVQVGSDRIVALIIRSSNGVYKLIVELVPRGIIALVDDKGKIIYSSEYKEMRDRVIRRGEEYKPPPPPPNIIEISVDEALKLVGKGKDIVRGLVRGLGIPGELAEEALARLGIDKKTKVKDIDRDTLKKILDEVRGIIKSVEEGRIEPCIVEVNGVAETVLPFKPIVYANARLIEYSSFNKALDEYFTRIEREEKALKEKKEVEELKEKLLSSIEKQKKLIEEYQSKAKELKEKADTLSTNYVALEEVVNCVNKAFDSKGWNGVKECPSIVGYDKSRGLVKARISGVEVEFKVGSKPYDILRELYEEAKSYRRKAEKAEEALRDLEVKLNELVEKAHRIAEKTKAKIRRREWYERYHWMITSGGYLVIGGRNIDQNESIVRKLLEPNDIFMHADIHGAPVVIVKTQGKTPSSEDLREAALLAACYSKAWKQGLGYVDVYWVKGSQVSKSPPSGEYLPKGSFMVYGKRNYIRVELRLGIGIEIIDKSPRIIVSPPDKIPSKTGYYAILVPGDQDPSKTAKKLREHWVKKAPKEEKPIIEALTVDDIRERLPGRSRVLVVKP